MSTKKPKKKRITNKQVREELFIVIEYLFKFTSAEKPLIQAELIAYALETYGVEIRRDRIPVICQHLEDLTSTYPDKFSFEVISFKLPRQTRYYAVKSVLEEEDVEAIILAVNKYGLISRQRSALLIERIKQLALTRAQNENLFPRTKYNTYPHQPDFLIKRIDMLRSAKDKRALVNFMVSKKYITENYTFNRNENYYGYIRDLMQFNNDAYAVIFVTGDVSKLAVFNIIHLQLTSQPIDLEGDAPEISELYRAAYGGDINAMLLESTLPFGEGSAQDVTFTFADADNNLAIIKTSFEFTFRRKMESTKENNIITVNFRVNSFAFLIWATSLTVANIIHVTGNEVVTQEILKHYEEQLKKHTAN